MISKHADHAFSSFSSFAQSFLRPASIFSFAPVGLSFSLILSHNLIPTLNCSLKAPLHPSIPKTLPTDSYQNQIAGLMHYSILSLNRSHLTRVSSESS